MFLVNVLRVMVTQVITRQVSIQGERASHQTSANDEAHGPEFSRNIARSKPERKLSPLTARTTFHRFLAWTAIRRTKLLLSSGVASLESRRGSSSGVAEEERLESRGTSCATDDGLHGG